MFRPQIRRRAAVVLGVLALLVPTVSAHAAGPVRPGCGERDFCLFAGPQQTGSVLYRHTVTVHEDGMVDLAAEDVLNPALRARSARLPGLPEGLACIAVLFEGPHYQGDNQEAPYGYPIDDVSLVELNGQVVGSFYSDCG